MELSNTHLWSLAITLLITLLPGIIISRKVKSSDDYNVGGRSAGAGMVAGSIIGTIIGGASTVGTAQLGFKLGLTAWWFTLGSGIALLLMAFFYAAPLRQSKLTTIAEFLVLNYGKPAGWIAIFSSCAGIFFSIVSSTLTGLHLLAGLFQVTLPVAAVLILVITAGFVFFGGISGSGMAGIMKMLVIFATIFVLIIICISLYNKFLSIIEENTNYRIKLELDKMEKEYSVQIDDKLKQLHSLRHDMKNHLIILYGYAAKNETDHICAYINRIADDLSLTNTVDSGSHIVSALIVREADKQSMVCTCTVFLRGTGFSGKLYRPGFRENGRIGYADYFSHAFVYQIPDAGINIHF